MGNLQKWNQQKMGYHKMMQTVKGCKTTYLRLQTNTALLDTPPEEQDGTWEYNTLEVRKIIFPQTTMTSGSSC